MQVVEKFVINRKDLKYIYVERTEGNFNHNQYNVYHNMKNCQKLSDNDFYLTFGDDEVLTLMEYIKGVQDDILFENVNKNIISKLLIELKKVEMRIKPFNKNNPSLWGYKATFLSCIELFNKVIEENPREKDEYDYQTDIDRLEDNNIDDVLVALNDPNKPLVRVRKKDNLVYISDEEQKVA